jgi:molybdopterin/thiamine biosynthesis adenylyltransferase
MTPLVYVREQDLRAVRSADLPAVGALAWDDDTVFHVYLASSRVSCGSHALTAQIVPITTATENTEKGVIESLRRSRDPKPRLYLLTLPDSDLICYFAPDDDKFLKCDVRFIPEQSDLYSRSKGLLESDVLSRKSVGIIGVGSGGSAIAIELAKASVGRFSLIDFDRLELSNVARHVSGVTDLGRYKTFAVRDAILNKNPHAEVTTYEIDVNDRRHECSTALAEVDLIICASDNDRSRFLLNELALKHNVTAIFGRALTRASGGDVLRVRPYNGPCYSCLYSQSVRSSGGDDEEISQMSQAAQLLPEYTSARELTAVVQVGLSSDIAPISNFMVKLALVELSKGLPSGIRSLEDDLVADFYIWANRREGAYQDWNKLEFNFNRPSILRWYGARVERDPKCLVCGDQPQLK